MAKSYDIYLNRRLDELDLVLHHLPYRDGIFAHTELCLDAALNILTLTKLLAAKNDASLHARIDTLTEYVMELMRASAELRTPHPTTSAYKGAAGRTRMELRTPPPPITNNLLERMETFTALVTSCITADLIATTKPTAASMELTTKAAQVLKTATEELSGELEIAIAGAEHAEKRERFDARLSLATAAAAMAYLLHAQAKGRLFLGCASSGEELWYSLGSAQGVVTLSANRPSLRIEKRLDAGMALHLLSYAREMMALLVPAVETSMALEAKAEVLVGRLRLVHELDGLALDTLDSRDGFRMEFNLD